jgi:murein DD-endopeptidase MepM/ murein hydrolase activator NlpD
VPELSDIKFAEPLHVLISGSAMLYELAGAEHARGTPVPKLEAAFPGIRRLLHEGHLRYTFVRFGAPYILSLECYDGPRPRFRLPACRQADRVLIHLLNALRVVGGKPAASEPKPAQVVGIERPKKVSSRFHYYPPGRLVPNSSVRKLGGNTDNTVYANIRFPLAEAPANVSSQVRWRRSPPIGKDDAGAYAWRDNFCERRSFRVGQCPAGFGHQGQDIRPPPCKRSNGETCRTRHDVVAVRDGAILRAPRQEAAYLVVNSATEHLRFRYLHMHPGRMDEDNLLSGRVVREGEVIGQVSNYSRKAAGTSYHLHFDLKVPTSDGWVFVNPYMTLITAYERLIGERGQQIKDDLVAHAEASVGPGKPAVSSGRKPASHSTLGIHTTVKVLADEVKPPKVVHDKNHKGTGSCGRRCR